MPTTGPIRRLFDKVQAKRLGATEADIRRVMIALDRQEPIDQQPLELTTLEVIEALKNEKPAEFCEADKAGINWDEFGKFVQMIIAAIMAAVIKQRKPTDAPNQPRR